MRNRRSATVVGVTVGVLLVAIAVPVAAHSNTIEASSQLSPDGTVVAESVFVFEDAWLVVHRDDGGSVGEPIGRTLVGPNNLETEVPVEIDRAVWESWNDARPVHLALHHDDGDGEFTPADDQILSSGETTATKRIVVAKGGQRAYVHAAGLEAQETTGNVTVREAVLPADGFLVVRPSPESDRVLGTTALDAGAHQSESIRIDEEFYTYQDTRFEISITIYRDDGDGKFGDGDSMLRVGGEPVSTTVTLERTDDRTPVATTPSTEDGGTNNDTDSEDDHTHEEGEGDDHTHEEGEGHEEGDGHEGTSTKTEASDTVGDDGAAVGTVVVLLVIGITAIRLHRLERAD